MKRAFVLLVVPVVLVGCQQPRSTPVAEAAEDPASQPSADIEFAKWPTATDNPVHLTPQLTDCAPPWSHGLHFEHYIVVRVNPEAMKEFKAVDKPLPVGTTIVKEKHTDW